MQQYVNSIVGDLAQAAVDCSSALEGIDAGANGDAGWLPELSPSDGLTPHAWMDFQCVTYTSTVPTGGQVPIWDCSVAAPSANWVLDSGGKELLSDAGDAIGKAWNPVFG
ncbi:hypothetical protein ACQ7DA_04420 [Zafaria sp. J156]|uniref:hypothetical protein n=1 Tax=Zafaria sp. J156 TaxID=3116490 RepID=UPI002E76C26F|nr:hypothetical protein [Zafaria sp. J156]MEE1620470.1 hypothetical protein [Zafaria sp. J156]